jgi:hypothetical protein
LFAGQAATRRAVWRIVRNLIIPDHAVGFSLLFFLFFLFCGQKRKLTTEQDEKI